MNTTIQSSENIAFGGRFLRFALGATLLLPVFTISGHIGAWSVLALLAVFPVISAIYGYCPLVNWMQQLSQAGASQRDAQFALRLDKAQRISYGLLAAVLIGSVFVASTSSSIGFWLILPLLGIYPAALAIYGEKLLSAVIASSIATAEPTRAQSTSATVTTLTQSATAKSDHHVSVDHAA